MNSNGPAMPLELPRLEAELEIAESNYLREPLAFHRILPDHTKSHWNHMPPGTFPDRIDGTAESTPEQKETTLKPHTLTQIAGLAIAAALVMPVRGAPPDENNQNRFPHYRVVDLATLGGDYSFAYGIGSTGAVAGSSATASQHGDPAQTVPQPPQTAFLWDRAHLINLGTLGGPNSAANGPNAYGETLVISDTDRADPNGEDFCNFGTHLTCRAAIWRGETLTALATLPGGNNTQAYWINDRGQAIGFSETQTDAKRKAGYCATPSQVLDFEAVIWEPDGTSGNCGHSRATLSRSDSVSITAAKRWGVGFVLEYCGTALYP